MISRIFGRKNVLYIKIFGQKNAYIPLKFGRKYVFLHRDHQKYKDYA